MSAVSTSTPLLIRQLERLPTNPTAAVRVLWLADDPNSSSEDLAAAVSTDPALTTRIMHLANSAYYGLSGRVPSGAFAITVLGFSAVRTLAAAAAAGALDPNGAVPDGFWSHAATTAVASSLAADRVGASRTEAFSLGLLHDIGRALLHRVDPEGYAELSAEARAGGRPLCLAEQETYGMDHADAAARVLRAWRFPDDFVVAIGGHHDPLPPSALPLARALHVGEALAVLADEDRSDELEDVEEARRVVEETGVSDDDRDLLVGQIKREADALAVSFSTP